MIVISNVNWALGNNVLTTSHCFLRQMRLENEANPGVAISFCLVRRYHKENVNITPALLNESFSAVNSTKAPFELLCRESL